MVDASQVFQPIFPPGNGSIVVSSLDTPLGPSIVRRILVTFPAGCGGLVGIRISAAQGFAFPSVQGQYITFDDYTYPFDVSNQIDGGNWSIYGYNIDWIAHEVQVVYEYDYLRQPVNQSSSNLIAL